MNPVFLKNDVISLRPLSQEDDVTGYAQWLNDQQTTFFMWSGNFPQNANMLKKYIADYEKNENGILLGIFISDGSTHVGNITLHAIDWKNRTAEIGVIVGRESQGNGYAGQALKLVIEHAFEKLNLRRVYSLIVDGNDASKKLFEKMGFQLEGIYREHFYLEGKYLDCCFYGLLKKDYLGEHVSQSDSTVNMLAEAKENV